MNDKDEEGKGEEDDENECGTTVQLWLVADGSDGRSDATVPLQYECGPDTLAHRPTVRNQGIVRRNEGGKGNYDTTRTTWHFQKWRLRLRSTWAGWLR